MVRPATLDRGNEKFVQWKEPLQSKGDTTNFDGHDYTSRVRKKKQTARQNSTLTSPVASILGSGVEERGHARNPATVLIETGVGTLSPSHAEVHSVAPLPRFKPPRCVQSTRSTLLLPRSTVPEGASEQTPNMLPESNNDRASRNESLQHQGPRNWSAHGTRFMDESCNAPGN